MAKNNAADLLKRFEQAKQVAERVLALEQELARQREILRQFAEGEAVPRVALEPPPEQGREEALATRIRMLLKSQPGVPMGPKDVVAALLLPAEKVQRVGEVLNHLARKPKMWRIERVARGKYQYS